MSRWSSIHSLVFSLVTEMMPLTCTVYCRTTRDHPTHADFAIDWIFNGTLITSPGSDTVTAIFKCNSCNTTSSLACWQWPSFHRHLKYSSQFIDIQVFWSAARVSFLHSWLCKQNGGQCDWASLSKWVRRPSHTGYFNGCLRCGVIIIWSESTNYFSPQV